MKDLFTIEVIGDGKRVFLGYTPNTPENAQREAVIQLTREEAESLNKDAGEMQMTYACGQKGSDFYTKCEAEAKRLIDSYKDGGHIVCLPFYPTEGEIK